jgi:hypothetical protein
MMDIYQPVIDWIDPDLHVIKVAEMTDTNENTKNQMDIYKTICINIMNICIMALFSA